METLSMFFRRYGVSGTIKLSLFIVIVTVGAGSAASLESISDFGDNPSNLKMFLYVPDDVALRPPVLVGLHWCHGTANAYFTGNSY